MTAPKRSRGRETALDMVRSLGLILVVVIPFALFFNHTSAHDTKRIRPVDPTQALEGFARDTGAPIPSIPPGWVPNVAVGSVGSVRVGYVIGDHYAEFAGGRGDGFLNDVTGKGVARGVVDIRGVPWQDYLSPDGHETLVRILKGAVIAVGGVREDVSQQQLRTLAGTVRLFAG